MKTKQFKKLVTDLKEYNLNSLSDAVSNKVEDVEHALLFRDGYVVNEIAGYIAGELLTYSSLFFMASPNFMTLLLARTAGANLGRVAAHDVNLGEKYLTSFLYKNHLTDYCDSLLEKCKRGSGNSAEEMYLQALDKELQMLKADIRWYNNGTSIFLGIGSFIVLPMIFNLNGLCKWILGSLTESNLTANIFAGIGAGLFGFTAGVAINAANERINTPAATLAR